MASKGQHVVEVDRVLPHDLAAERAVLGAIMLHNEAIDTVESLEAPDFFRDAHRRLYESMLHLRQDGTPIDLMTLRAELSRRGDLEEAGGSVYIAPLIDGVPRAANIEYYAAIIVEHARRRQAIREANRLAAGAYEASDPASTLLTETAERLFALCNKADTGQALPLSEIAPLGMAAIERAMKSGSLVTGLPMGFTELDEMTSGMQPSDLFIVAARTSGGKTSFAMNAARNVAGTGRVVLVHSCEMSREQLFLRMLASEARVDSKRLRSGALSQGEWSHVAKAMSALGTLRIYIDDTPNVSCRDIEARARKLRAQFGEFEPALIVVDYLQLMRGHGRFDNRTQEIGSISRGLKGIAKKMRTSVTALSQLSRPPEARRSKRPQLSDLRESGDIENDADTVLMLFRPDDEDSVGVAEVVVAKQRNGPIGSVKLSFLDYCTRFENLSYRTDVPV